MTTTVLAYLPSPPQGVWHLGPVPIRAYAVFIIVGIVVALLIGDRRWEARGGERGVIYDIALWAVPFGLIGGRLYHLSTDWRTYFGQGGAGLSAALRIWDGGLGIWGAVALGGVGAWIGCRRRGIPLPAFGDAVAPGIVLAQAIGRLGNYFNQELFGRETTMPWGLEIFYRRDPSGFVDVHSLDGVSTGQLAMVVQPTFLYELLWNVLIFVVLIYLDRRFTIGHGRLFALYVAGYCVGRFVVELLRDDTATHIAGIRINSFTSTFVFIGAVVYIILAPKGREDPTTLGGTRHAAEEAPVPEPASELAAVASASGAAAAAPVAGRADGERVVVEPGDSAETKADQPEAEAVAAEAEAVEGDAPEVEVVPPEVVESAARETGAERAEPEPEVEVPGAARPEGEAEAVAAEAEAGDAEEPEAEPLGEGPIRGLRRWRSRLRDLRSRRRLVEGDESETEEPKAEEVSEAERPEGEAEAVAAQAESAEAEVPEGDPMPAEAVESVAEQPKPTEPETAAEPVAEKVESSDDEGGVAKGSPPEPLSEEPTGELRRWRSRLRDLRSRSRR
ncbi:MAG: prolipoprotein diacylglyceryl transferase [Mycobacterium sp.]|nr:prolipoprotein diacylglyceryl transferase [Mycobacterium sp.]